MNNYEQEEEKEWRNILQECLEVESGLSDWEVDFLDSLNNWRGSFSEKQQITLEKIYKRVC